jgi:hypothetical protein
MTLYYKKALLAPGSLEGGGNMVDVLDKLEQLAKEQPEGCWIRSCGMYTRSGNGLPRPHVYPPTLRI